MRFAGKTVIVTGGAQGLGLATALAFSSAGADVVVADIDAEALEEAAPRIASHCPSARFVVADVSLEYDAQTIIERALEVNGRIDVLVNNAGIGCLEKIENWNISKWDRVIQVNLRGAYLCSANAAPHMPPGSAIVNISSIRALMSEGDTEAYAASKGGILALTHSLAISLGPRRIRVNAISPGWIDVTPWEKSSVRKPAVLREEDHAQQPVGRVGVPEDIAQACMFLADANTSGFITGQNLVVDGGMSVKLSYLS